jgi:hypothetical protein
VVDDAVREEEAAQRVREAEGAKAEAQARVTQAEARTAAAEAAKIELSLKLAEALSQQEDAADVSAVPTPVAPRSSTVTTPVVFQLHLHQTFLCLPKNPKPCFQHASFGHKLDQAAGESAWGNMSKKILRHDGCATSMIWASVRLSHFQRGLRQLQCGRSV